MMAMRVEPDLAEEIDQIRRNNPGYIPTRSDVIKDLVRLGLKTLKARQQEAAGAK
jgi:metal-responsive CopG/Arc/MetJ family transcriptional regulator